MSKSNTHVLIAIGGYLPSPVVEKIVITDQDEEFLEDEDGWTSFEEYEEYVLSESKAEYEQRFAQVIVLDESHFQCLKETTI